MRKREVLFVCVHNSARSQMAEAWCNHLFGDMFEAESAGLDDAGALNPLAVKAMKEVGIDISQNHTQRVLDLFKASRLFAYVVTVCDQANAERCPIFPNVTKRLHWSFADPAALSGSFEEKMEETRKIRDEIREAIEEWANEIKVEMYISHSPAFSSIEEYTRQTILA